ncbi:MAG: hypothetical protein EXS35_16230 [Pedosphaera sp.]|nr:hypothetical protein [Pedosphaera sp.]
MTSHFFTGAVLGLTIYVSGAADFQPAAQQFRQEVAHLYPLPKPVQLVECAPGGLNRAFVAGEWLEWRDDQWRVNAVLNQRQADHFVFASLAGAPVEAPMPWREIKQLLRDGKTNWLLTAHACRSLSEGGQSSSHSFPAAVTAQQMAISPRGVVHVASSGGLLTLTDKGWQPMEILDGGGRAWAVRDVLGVGFDSLGQLWFATKAGVGCQTAKGWRFYEGKDGLPWNDFTGIAAGPQGEVWFTTHLGVIRFEGGQWHYRQGRGWLPSDDVAQAAMDAAGDAWFATTAGIGRIEHKSMTLAAKAELFEQEIERYIKRTPFGYVAEAALRKPEDKSSANPHDSDNDGLWTAMYGAGECFAYAATKDLKAKERAKKAFEALRFLQKVTQGGEHSPPKGYVARTIRPVEWPDPNIGRLEGDRDEQRRDKLWKVYEPRWPKSADGKWYWKSDTSSDELDGHYFFYPLYFDFCADNDAEKERVREVVRDLTDHLLAHDHQLVDHDGKPTRWGMFGPQTFNRDPIWWQERGLNSLSMLSYLAVAAHVTGDAKYTRASRELIERHGYAHNLMYPKVQQGAGSGNQSDDEMAIMSYYGLLRCSTDEELKPMARLSFFLYWLNESQEMNPFFNFAHAALNANARGATPFLEFSLKPSAGWFEDSLATLRGFPLDRLAWDHRNSHRLDVVALPRTRSVDLVDPDAPRRRGHRVNGKVLPVENRHFGHWNTDPWHLDYGGNGSELSAGTVFLLPYYLGLYHGFIQKPGG